jgi:predicted acylesterase/phospholipase RssA
MNGADEVTGVILSGGSAYAAYEVGVMKALFRGEAPISGGVPIEAQVFAGASAGSVNATWMVSQARQGLADAVKNLESLWLDEISTRMADGSDGAVRFRANPLEFLNPANFTTSPAAPFLHLAQDISFFLRDWSSRAKNFADENESLRRRLVELIDISSIVSLEPLRGILHRDFSFSAIRETAVKLSVAATNWATGNLKLFANPDMSDADGVDIIMASTAFPGLPPVYIGGQPFVDGGYVMNTPLLPTIDAGASTVHLIYLDPDTAAIPVRRLMNTVDVIDRMFIMLRAAIVNRDIDQAAAINSGIALMESVNGAQPALADLKSFIKVASKIKSKLDQGIPYRQITIHRYHPSDDLGGVVGLLNFEQNQIAHLIDRGYHDAMSHNCSESQCILPGG